jgi:predicted NBD/HSP70 family sugar kinase
VINGVDLKKALKARAPLHIENDAKCFALAEHGHGAAKGTKNMIGVVIGTGVGSGIIIDNKVYRGSNGDAGEIGHQLIPGMGEWEDLISGPAVLKRHKARGGKEDKVSAIWESRTPLARKTQEEMVAYIAMFIHNLQLIFEPEMIVLGGGVSCLPLVGAVNKEIKRLGGRPLLRQNLLGIDAGIIGATL